MSWQPGNSQPQPPAQKTTSDETTRKNDDNDDAGGRDDRLVSSQFRFFLPHDARFPATNTSMLTSRCKIAQPPLRILFASGYAARGHFGTAD